MSNASGYASAGAARRVAAAVARNTLVPMAPVASVAAVAGVNDAPLPHADSACAPLIAFAPFVAVIERAHVAPHEEVAFLVVERRRAFQRFQH